MRSTPCGKFYVCLIIFSFISIGLQNLFSNPTSNEIKFDPNFKPVDEDISKEIPYGKKILVTGELKNDIINIVVNCYVNTITKKYEASLKEGYWEAIIGPFPPGQDIIFSFDVSKKMSDDEKVHLKNDLNKALKESIEKFMKEVKQASAEVFIELTKEWLVEGLSQDYDKYKTPKGESLREAVARQFSLLGVEKIINEFYNNVLEVQKKEEIIEELRAEDEKKNEAIIKEREEEIKKLKEEINTQAENIVEKVEEKVERKENIFIKQSFSTSAEVSDLESYAGFDICGVYVLPRNGFVTMFSLNPYLARIDLSQEPGKLKDRVSLSIGIGLNSENIDHEGKIYYAGIGCRINKVFRLTLGFTFIKKQKENYKSHFSLGLGLNFRDFGDLLKIFQGASSYFSE
jgi:hypothetical protein